MSLVQCIQDQAPYYRKLKKELDSETAIDSELSRARNERQSLENAIETKKSEINALENNSKKEFREVRKLRHLSFRSAAATLSGKKKEIVAKEEAKYQLAFENEQRSKRDLDGLQTRYEEALTREERLVSQKTHFHDTKLQIESLLEQIFAIEDPNFPSEPQLKAELANYKDQRRLAKRDKGRFAEAERALAQCLIDTKKVIRLLDTVVNYVPFEIFGGPMIDEEQVAYIDAAKRRVWEIQRLLNVARTELPEIPYPHTLDVVTNNPLLNMQISMTYVDALWRAKTTQCFGMLATAYRNIQNSLTWVKEYHEYTKGAIIRLDAVIETTTVALQNERRRIMDAVLAGHVDTSGSSSSYQPSSNDPPPPVYEAPPAEYNSDTTRQSSNELPSIPANLSPSPSFPHIPMSDSSSPLLPPAHLATNPNPSVPPQPISPVLGHTDTSPPHQQGYVSHNAK